jgi:hypothetical protein
VADIACQVATTARPGLVRAGRTPKFTIGRPGVAARAAIVVAVTLLATVFDDAPTGPDLPAVVADNVGVTASVVLEPPKQDVGQISDEMASGSVTASGSVDDAASQAADPVPSPHLASPLAQIITVRVIPGPFKWLSKPSDAPPAGTRVASGTVAYLHGDDAMWEAVAVVYGMADVQLQPSCTADPVNYPASYIGSESYVPHVEAGPAVNTADGEPAAGVDVVLCRSVTTPSGGVFHATLDAYGPVPPGGRVDVVLRKR